MARDLTADLQSGLSAERRLVVEAEHTALRWSSGGVDVLSTPQLVALVEYAALDAVDPHLPQGWVTVGTRIDLEHVAATPVGLAVVACATLSGIRGRHLTFQVEASDPTGLVGRGTHERVIVEKETFESRARAKIAGASPLEERH